ncbi:MAG: DNA helicase RecQ [Fusobacteriota bacterium]
MKKKALKLLKKYYGYNSFKEGQFEIIENILKGRDSLGIMPTGGGKSICYQIPSLIFKGVTIVISPLISLMKDQVDALTEAGISATYINSSLGLKEKQERLRKIRRGDYNLIYVAPERLNSDFFINMIDNLKISLVAVDEAHCISHWGHDFRKSYLEIPKFIEKINSNPVQAAFTATATEEVQNDIQNLLKLKRPKKIITGFDRENLHFSVIKGENNNKYIDRYLSKNKGKSGIIYASTRKTVEALSKRLNKKGYKVGAYHAGLSKKERKKNQDDFLYDNIDIIVATNAFGMGIDKSNVNYVIHNNMPKDIESYYQEAGRAGRDGENAECILLFNPRDIMTQRYFIENNEYETSEENTERKYQKLNTMVNYIHTSECLRKYILKYFGDEVSEDNCDNCSNCVDTKDKEDITVESKKIISCIGRTKERYGITVICKTLNGSKSKGILNKNLDKVSTYGLMDDYTVKDIRAMINLLIGDGYLRITTGEYPLVKLTKKAYDFLKDDKKIYRKISKIEKTYEANEELFSKLKELRNEIAKKDGVPPYVIFSNKTLIDMTNKLPVTREEMLDIKGVGDVKYDKYGKKFQEQLKKYKDENGDNLSQHKVTKIRRSKKGPSHLISYKMYKKGMSLDEIALERNLATQTIFGHIMKSGQEGKVVLYDDFFDEETEEEVLEAVKKVGRGKLKKIKEVVSEKVSYNNIKAVLNKNELY